MVEKILSRSVRLMFAGSMVIGMSAFAQEAVQRVEVTGSSIKKIASETALPVQTLSKAQIAETGATTAADLIASLPSMQGFTTSSASINGGGAGAQTASVHGIGENYTLVLLNGRRMAPFTSGSTVNLANIPLSAVERIEILTDGASALYGSDAIAGVVNFILKKNQKDFNIEFTYSTPQESAKGKTTNFAISKGWGDLGSDGYNILLSYSRDEQKELNASDRDYAKLGGLTRFKNNGKNYAMFMNSINSIPGNVELGDKGYENVDDLLNPYLVNNGKCPAANTEIGNGGATCRFNYAATVQILPELKRDNFFGSVNVNLNADHKFFAEGMMTKFTSTARYAPPAQPLGIDLNSNYYKNIIVPAYVKTGGDPKKIVEGTMYLRLVDAGGRTDAYKTESNHLSTGFDGAFGDWNYNASYVFSENKATDSAVAGYTSGEKLEALIKSGAWNPFAEPTATSQAALAPAVLRQELDNTKSQINVLSARASRELFKMDGGNAGLGLGADFTKQTYVYNPSPIAQGPNKQQPNWTDTNIGGGTGALPVDASRNNWGGFAELQLPVMKTLELTVAARYDSYEAVKNAKNFDDLGNLLAPATQGTTQSAGTYKLAAAFKPNDGLLVRSSFGTGFKAPTLTDVTNPLKNGGSSNFFPCPQPVATGPLKGLCRGTAEYNLLVGGNGFTDGRALKPEKSTQWTLGFRVEPIQSLSLGMDMWSVELKDQIKTLSQATVFKDTTGQYSNLFVSYYDPIQKQSVLAGIFRPTNIANAKYSGVDWDHTFKTNTSMGKVSVNWTGTYMLKADLEKEKGKPVEKTVGNFNSYNDVTFRIISKLATSWKPSDRYTHSATVNYHSSYKDQSYTAADRIVRDVNADGSLGAYVASSRTVAASYTVDLQSKVFLSKNFTLTGGIKNLFNQDPPFSQRNAGGGNQLGFDARYAETLGRQFYVVGNIKF